jgi:hypothetical protein
MYGCVKAISLNSATYRYEKKIANIFTDMLPQKKDHTISQK